MESGDKKWAKSSRESQIESSGPERIGGRPGEEENVSPFAEVMASASRNVLQKYPPAHRVINSNGISEPVKVEYPSVDRIANDENLILWIRKIHAAMAGNLHFLDEVYKQKDDNLNSLKLEAVKFQIFKYRHDEELQNWSNTLKQLLTANGKLMEARQRERSGSVIFNTLTHE